MKQQQFSKDEICTFVAIILPCGYNARPLQRRYWSQDDNLACPAVPRNMTRNRFEKIKRFLHFADNEFFFHEDKMAKIRLIQEAVNASLQQCKVFAEDLSVDEQMVPYFRSQSCKIFIRRKPIRFGYKNWILASSHGGYPLKFETYVGVSEMRRDQSLGPRVVLNLPLIIENPRQHCACFDNFFTSYQLLVGLKEK